MNPELQQRMTREQRHRLLHGYPMAPLMEPAPERPLPSPGRASAIVGVLPHPFCNPRVRGCGFCTFPHETFSNASARRVTGAVCREIYRQSDRLSDVRVPAVYIGGGTANLTPPDAFGSLCDALSETFDLADAEVTLEGVPAYFLLHESKLLHLMIEALRVRQRRISMGIQTFDSTWLKRMGRQAFGTRSTVADVVRTAHHLGFTTSGDLLMNLPGQTLPEILEDIRIADGLGLDQICVYHLVLYEGLGTEWSKDPELLAKRVDNNEALRRWLVVREALLERGFVQTTLTNFERREVNESPERFIYEEHSFAPWRHQAVGFGPGAISTVRRHRRELLKWIHPDSAADYLASVDEGGPYTGRAFSYREPEDEMLLFLTRGLSRGHVRLTELPLSPSVEQLASLEACKAAGLLTMSDDTLRLTPRGMFYADAVTGLLAASRARALTSGRPRRHLRVNDSRGARMG